MLLVAICIRIRFNCDVADRQLRLFAHAKPLLERIGPGFFRAAPRGPGVYVMSGRTGEILYVGQSGNLRARLNCYKNGNPDALPRRVVRLIHSVASITWEECASRQLARVRENELLRLHRPKFNRVNTYPPAYGFVGLGACERELTLFRLREPFLDKRNECRVRVNEAAVGATGRAVKVERALPPHPGPLPGGEGETRGRSVHIYGAFKGGAVYGFGSLLRLLWSAIYQPTSPFDLPRQLVNAKPPRRFTLALIRCGSLAGGTKLIEQIDAYLSGESEDLIEWLRMAVRTEGLSWFHRNFIQADLELLTWFFETGPKRIWRLKREHGIGEGLVAKEELDDLIALSGA